MLSLAEHRKLPKENECISALNMNFGMTCTQLCSVGTGALTEALMNKTDDMTLVEHHNYVSIADPLKGCI